MTDASRSPLIVALDYPSAGPALALARRLSPELCRLKVGKELFTAAGPDLVKALVDLGYSVFLDLKFHDIPHTVAKACQAAARLGVWMLNVHALGGQAMLETARQAVSESDVPPLLVAVTVLTSLTQKDLIRLGIIGTPGDAVLRWAHLARECGLDGVVCSAEEASMLRRECGPGFCLVTPGIRPADAAQDDQQRVATPAQALAVGADYLVIGRPITGATDPEQALRKILSDLKQGI